MLGQIRIVNEEMAEKALKQMAENGDIVPLSSEHFEMRWIETKPVEGYELPETFPFHDERYKKLYQEAVENLQSFPLCCESHKKLLQAQWFKKEDYEYFPLKLVKAVSYTLHCVDKYIGAPSWYELITDYIEMTEQSFGQFPHGFGSPLGLSQYINVVKHSIRTANEIPSAKRKLLVDYFEKRDKEELPASKTDLNILLQTYKQWLKMFPFELETYFGELKEKFNHELPFLDGDPYVNIYSGMAKAKLITKERLFEVLINLTNKLLTEINGSSLLTKGLIGNAEKMQVEIIIQERNQELKQGYKNSSPDEGHRFRKMIKDWLQHERLFWKKLSTLFEKNTALVGPKSIPYQPIDEDLFVHHRIPFEITCIYKRYYADRGSRFIRIADYDFYTPTDTYHFFLEDWKSGKLFTEYLEPLSQDNIQPYYRAYQKGFLKGYHEFDEKIKSTTTIFEGNEATLRRVFEYINTPFQGFASYGSEWLNDKLVQTITKPIWFQAGIRAGENYKAWFFVINNYELFLPLFRTYKPYVDSYKDTAKYWKEQPGGQGIYSHAIKLLAELGEDCSQLNNESEENDFVRSTIEDYLFSLKEAFISSKEYEQTIDTIYSFLTGQVGMAGKMIFVKNGYKKKLAFALGECYKSNRNEAISKDYLKFLKSKFTIFKGEDLDSLPLISTNLYKYVTSKT